MSKKLSTQCSCNERRRLEQEFSELIRRKFVIRDEIASGVILNPGERRATLIRTNELLDGVIAIMREHEKHCVHGNADVST